MRFRDRLINFMQGRYITYGQDSLSKFLFGVTVALIFINMILRSGIVYILVLALIFYTYYRLLSRNIYKRYHENDVYVGYRNKFLGFWNNIRYRIGQTKSYHIYKCPSCKQKIRIPRGKGNIVVRCPKCRTEFRKHS